MEGPRLATADDLPSMVALLNQCFSENLPEGMERRWPHVLPRNPDSGVRHVVFEDQGAVVSCVAVVPMRLSVGGGTLRVGGVSCVATLGEYRGRGLMTAALECADKIMREQGLAASWLNGDRTRYRWFGYERAGRKLNITITPRSFAGSGGSVASVARFDGQPSHMDSIVRIYERRGIGGVRDAALWRVLLGRPRKETLLAFRDGSATAYMVFERKKAESVVEVFEYGGDADGIRALLRHGFEALGFRQMEVSAPIAGDPLVDLLTGAARKWSVGFSGWLESGGMLRVLDLAACLRAFLPQITEKRRLRDDGRRGTVALKIAETEQTAALRFGETVEVVQDATGDGVPFGEADLAGFLFGLSEPIPSDRRLALLGNLLPLDFHIWPLEMV